MFAIIHFMALVRKELLQLFRNPRSCATILMPPLLQVTIFGYAATLDLTLIRFALLDQDRSVASVEMAGRFTGSGIFRETVRPANEKELAEAIDNRRILLGVVIPRNFQRDLESGGRGEVRLIADGRNSNTAGIALGYANGVVELFNTRYSRRHQTPAPALKLETRAWFNPNYNMRYFMIPALLAILALLDIILITSMSVAREREEGTFDQLLVAPYSPGEILGAKAISCIMVGLMQLTLVFLEGKYWFEVPFYGSYAMLGLGFLVFLLASVGCGLMISVLSSTLQQALLGTFLCAVPFVLLSGLSTPVESMPLFFQYLTTVNPIRYGIKMLQRLFLEGAGMAQLWPYYLMMISIAAVMISGSYLIFRRQLRE